MLILSLMCAVCPDKCSVKCTNSSSYRVSEAGIQMCCSNLKLISMVSKTTCVLYLYLYNNCIIQTTQSNIPPTMASATLLIHTPPCSTAEIIIIAEIMNSTEVQNPRRKLDDKYLCLSCVWFCSCLCKVCSRVSEALFNTHFADLSVITLPQTLSTFHCILRLPNSSTLSNACTTVLHCGHTFLNRS